MAEPIGVIFYKFNIKKRKNDMSKGDIYRYLYTNSASLGMAEILRAMGECLIIALLIYLTYYIAYKGVAYSKKFNGTLVIVSLISCVIMLMISSNIIISLGMVGALSIVRFRTAIKDSRDTAFIFWAIAEGLCVGSENMRLASVTTLFISVIILVLEYIPSLGEKYLLIVQTDESIQNLSELEKIIQVEAGHYKTRAVNQNGTSTEYIFEVKGKVDTGIAQKIAAIQGVVNVNWILESGENLG